MSNRYILKPGAAIITAIYICTSAILPTASSSPAIAQVLSNQVRRLAISAGAVLPTTYSKDKIVITSKKIQEITLEIPNNIIDKNGKILIPARSQVKGRLEPASLNGKVGSQFIAEEIIFPNGMRRNINATSNIITNKGAMSKVNNNNMRVLEDTAAGIGAVALISLLTGDKKINALEIFAGGSLGAVAGTLFRRKKIATVVIEPNKGDLNITLRSNFIVPDKY
ncbi:hypothetical protein RINTHM_14540 [Richelia intracellularis HM01]|uniref:hypothetical protein n=1 Tax=Richelia intracellularis TaxID=1164990 RepID=UPI0002B5A9E8|nr:hypothetical protein [Richelia intracellularis]CCH65911.1 hypothetical protein RINTHM_14540 [Richelia intracellularis HM01]